MTKTSKKTENVKEKTLCKHDIMFDEAYVMKLLKNEQIDEVKKYVKKFFFRYKKEIFIFDGIKFDLYSQFDACKMIPNDLQITMMVADDATKKFMPEEFSVSKYLRSTDFMKDAYKPTIDFTKPTIFKKKTVIRGVEIVEKYINMAKPYGIDINSAPVELTDYIKEALQMIDNHLKNVLCSGNEASYKFNKNFFACTFAGRKLRKALYWQSDERTGKGQYINGLIKKILGDSMCKTSSVENVTTYTKPFEGCVLVNLDELPVEGGSWKSISDKLKGLITEPEFDSRTMHQTAYIMKNTFNILISTNNNAVNLTQTNNKRYHTNDIDQTKIDDIPYFTKLAKVIKDPMVRLAYYQQMMKHYETLSDWNEDIDELTDSKKSKMIEALPQFHKYIKEKYILCGRGIDMKTSEFFETYFEKSKDRTSKIQIGKYLTSMGIEPIKKATTQMDKQHYRYIISKDELYETFVEKKWIDSKVDLVNDNDDEEQEEALMKGVDTRDQSVDINAEWKKKYAELEAMCADVEAKYNTLLQSQTVTKPEPEPEPEEKPKKVKKTKVRKEEENNGVEFFEKILEKKKIIF